MSNQSFWMLWIVATVIVSRERARLGEAVATFAATFPDDAAMLVLDTTAEIVEVTP